jgi:hypothetical protein
MAADEVLVGQIDELALAVTSHAAHSQRPTDHCEI